jgi:hypothetical protein
MSAMTITHGEGGLPAVGDYISEDFLQVLEVSIFSTLTFTHFYLSFYRSTENYVNVKVNLQRPKQPGSV